MADNGVRPTFAPSVYYQDPRAALDWLEKAFGFEVAMVITDDSGTIVHSEMRLGRGLIMVSGEWADYTATPKNAGGKNTQNVHVLLEQDIDAHCQRARAAGAAIIQEPADQFYGDRTYRAMDLGGHAWTFGQTVREVTREQAEEVSGLKIEGWV